MLGSELFVGCSVGLRVVRGLGLGGKKREMAMVIKKHGSILPGLSLTCIPCSASPPASAVMALAAFELEVGWDFGEKDDYNILDRTL